MLPILLVPVSILNMEKNGMSALDIRFIVPELKAELIGGKIQKIYQYGTKVKEFLFGIYAKGNTKLLFADNSSIFISKAKEAVPQEPPTFAMLLRKHLMNRKILDIRQHEFDRIVEIETEGGLLVFELFPPGNLILVGDDGNIIMPAEFQRWKTREIKPKVAYKYPPRTINPMKLTHSDLHSMLQRTDRTLGAFCAVSLGLGPLYGDEVITRAGLESGTPGKELRAAETEKLFTALQEILGMGMKPVLYEDAVSPFPLESRKGAPSESMPSFSDAIDSFVTSARIELKSEKKEGLIAEERGRLERMEEKQVEAREKWESMEKEAGDTGNIIYQNYNLVQSVISRLNSARESGLEWDEIKRKIREEDTPEACSIKEIRENRGTVVLELGGKDVEIDFTEDVEANAARYYEKSKTARKKMGGAERAVRETRLEAEKLEEKLRTAEEEAPEEKEAAPKKPKRRRRRWFEKFKWFVSSEGFLVVAGRSAAQNEELMKKRTEDDEWIFHADIPGAAFVVIKKEKDRAEPGDETMKEAAEFAAANSKAWAKGMGNVDIFAVKRSQASKPGGLPKGSFVISGERLWFRDQELKLSVGVRVLDDEAVVISGPVMAVRKQTNYFVTIQPGFKKAGELVKEIKNRLLIKSRPEDKYLIERIDDEELEKMIPSGMGEIVLYG